MFQNIQKCIMQFRNVYKNSLNHHPYLLQSIQVSIIMGGSDILAQTAIERKSIKQLNLRRTLEFSCMGFCLVGPCLRYWYGKLDKFCSPIKNPWNRTITKVTCDQLLFAPAFIGVFISSLSLIQGNTVSDTIKRVQNEYPNILIGNYVIWPAAQMINFRLIPLNYQVIFVQFVAVIWNTYLSLKLNKNQKIELE